MSEFAFIDGVLYAEGVALTKIASHYGTPAYVYSRKMIESHWREFDSALGEQEHLVCYAVKANSNIAVLNILAKLGSGFDIVSIGELHRVLKAGGDASKVVFSGVGKREDEMAFSLKQGIKCFNVENANELIRLNEVAAHLNKQAPVSLRVNPDVDANTHPYISTGLKENKFGIAFEQAKEVYLQAKLMSNINIVGVDCHIGSQITKLNPFKDALECILVLIDELKQEDIELHHIDIGGGLGINYQGDEPPARADYVKVITDTLKGRGVEVLMEPGRSIVGNAGVLLTKVEYLNATPYHNFAVVDAAMNDLIRPALYEGWHDIKRVVESSNADAIDYDVVGPICETADFLGKNRTLQLEQGDLLAVCSAGAYGFTMASNYNSRPKVCELMVDGEQIHVIRERETLDDLVFGESLVS